MHIYQVFVTDDVLIGAERWEIRTRPLGCQVSTITSVTSVVTIASTIIFIGLVTGLVLAVKRIREYQQQQEAGRWQFWHHHWWNSQGSSGLLSSSYDDNGQAEQEPLLIARGSSASRSYDSELGADDYTRHTRPQRTAAWSPQISPKTSPTRHRHPELTGGMMATSSYS